jgi:hypothetical protein
MVSILHHYRVPLALAHEILVVAKIRKVPTSRALRKMRHLFKVMDSNASPREISADSSPPSRKSAPHHGGERPRTRRRDRLRIIEGALKIISDSKRHTKGTRGTKLARLTTPAIPKP